MSDHAVHRASELAGDERMILERWLGRTLASDETISVNAYRPHSDPGDARRQELRQAIVTQAKRIGNRGGDFADQELNKLLDEALNDVRGHRA